MSTNIYVAAKVNWSLITYTVPAVVLVKKTKQTKLCKGHVCICIHVSVNLTQGRTVLR